DVQFYITPSVEPSRAVLTKLIRLAGGTVHEDRPAPAEIARCIETDAPFIVSDQLRMRSTNGSVLAGVRLSVLFDLALLIIVTIPYLVLAVYNTDMVLIALMRQELEPHPLYRVNTASLARPTPAPSSQPQTTPGHSHFRPVSQPQPHCVKA
ncbi:BRCT domain-containing protein, partial [Trichostrongylus colubriformis]